MFNGNKIVLDEEILNIREGKEKEKSDAKEKVIKNAISKFNTRRDAYKALIDSSIEEIKYTAKQKKAAIQFKKLKTDKAVPLRAAGITARFNETKDRPVMTVRQYLTDLGYYTDGEEYTDIVEHLLAVDAQIAVETELDVEVDPLNSTNDAIVEIVCRLFQKYVRSVYNKMYAQVYQGGTNIFCLIYYEILAL